MNLKYTLSKILLWIVVSGGGFGWLAYFISKDACHAEGWYAGALWFAVAVVADIAILGLYACGWYAVRFVKVYRRYRWHRLA